MQYGVVAAGIKPNSEIGARCGLTVERAIVVDNQMRSLEDHHIYVVGECAQHRGHVYSLVAPLWEQAKVLADHITGRDPQAAYHGSKVATKLKVMGVEMAAMGIIEPADERDEIVQFTLLFDIGAPSKKATIEELPLDAQVCNCNGVSKGAILSCIKAAGAAQRL